MGNPTVGKLTWENRRGVSNLGNHSCIRLTIINPLSTTLTPLATQLATYLRSQHIFHNALMKKFIHALPTTGPTTTRPLTSFLQTTTSQDTFLVVLQTATFQRKHINS